MFDIYKWLHGFLGKRPKISYVSIELSIRSSPIESNYRQHLWKIF